MLDYVTCHEDMQWSGGTAPYILTLSQGGGGHLQTPAIVLPSERVLVLIV